MFGLSVCDQSSSCLVSAFVIRVLLFGLSVCDQSSICYAFVFVIILLLFFSFFFFRSPAISLGFTTLG